MLVVVVEQAEVVDRAGEVRGFGFLVVGDGFLQVEGLNLDAVGVAAEITVLEQHSDLCQSLWAGVLARCDLFQQVVASLYIVCSLGLVVSVLCEGSLDQAHGESISSVLVFFLYGFLVVVC